MQRVCCVCSWPFLLGNQITRLPGLVGPYLVPSSHPCPLHALPPFCPPACLWARLVQCGLGDAFRCAGCPYRGLPAFEMGKPIQLPSDFLAADL